MPSEEELTGGFMTSSVRRVGNTVRRSAGPWTPAVHSWLGHLAAHDVRLAPQPLGIDAETETLSYVAGTVPSGGASPPYLWRDETLVALARLVRRFHDAAASYEAPPDARWQSHAAHPDGGDVVCHNDLAPWNTVFVNEQPVAFIDWDAAAPGPRWWDVVYAIWHFVPLYGDEASDPFPLDEFEPRAQRTRLFCDAYGTDDRTGLVDNIIERQLAVYRTFQRHAEAGEPAYQRLWDMGADDGILRQADYVRRNREDLNTALQRA